MSNHKPSYSGHLSLGTLWAQHNEDRIFFSNIIAVALAYTTHLNLFVEMYLSVALLFSDNRADHPHPQAAGSGHTPALLRSCRIALAVARSIRRHAVGIPDFVVSSHRRSCHIALSVGSKATLRTCVVRGNRGRCRRQLLSAPGLADLAGRPHPHLSPAKKHGLSSRLDHFWDSDDTVLFHWLQQQRFRGNKRRSPVRPPSPVRFRNIRHRER